MAIRNEDTDRSRIFGEPIDHVHEPIKFELVGSHGELLAPDRGLKIGALGSIFQGNGGRQCATGEHDGVEFFPHEDGALAKPFEQQVQITVVFHDPSVGSTSAGDLPEHFVVGGPYRHQAHLPAAVDIGANQLFSERDHILLSTPEIVCHAQVQAQHFFLGVHRCLKVAEQQGGVAAHH